MNLILQLSVDMDMIQFGTTVIDETLKRTFTLSNKGALGCTFNFFKATGTNFHHLHAFIFSPSFYV